MFNTLIKRTLKLFFLLVTANCYALSLDRMILYLNPDKLPRQNVVVFNHEKQKLFLQTIIYDVIAPGSEQEKRVQVQDLKNLQLITSPKKTIIPPQRRKTIQVISLLEKPPKIEKVFRVTFQPTLGDITATQTAIKILISYQILVFIRPKNPYYKITAKQKDNTLTFTNTGNMNVLMRNGQYCTGETNNTCQPLKKTERLYAKQSWKLNIPKNAVHIRYGLFDGTSEKTQTFNIKKKSKTFIKKREKKIKSNKQNLSQYKSQK